MRRTSHCQLHGQVALETVDNRPVLRTAPIEGGTPLVGSGEGGTATLDDLVKQAVEHFPSMFGTGETLAPAAKDSTGDPRCALPLPHSNGPRK
jgi:hypothetical protein